MQLSAPSPSSEISPAAAASSAVAADLAAFAPTAPGTGGENARGEFAFLFPNLSPAATTPMPTSVPSAGTAAGAEKPPGSPKSGPAPWAGGSRRPGFSVARPSSRPADKATDPADPTALLALAGVLPTSPGPADPALPALGLPADPPTGLPSGEADAPDFVSPPAMGTEPAPQATVESASPAALTGPKEAAISAASPSSGENVTGADMGFPDLPDSPSDQPAAPTPATVGGRSTALASVTGLTPGQGEKIAEAGARFDREGDGRGRSSEKKILSVLDKQVVEPRPNLGTDVAKPAPAMSNPSLLRTPSPDSTSGAVPGVAAAQHDRPPPAADSAAVTASQAHRAVEAVLSAADRVGAGEKQAVNLQFSFLDVSLAVRVELREGAVHTTFRTDSAELRSALAHEWQSVSTQISDRPIKMADPVFAANHGGADAFAGDSARQQQQQQHPPRDPSVRAGLEFLSSAAARPTAPAGAALPGTGVAPAPRPRRSTTNHLETFA